VNNAHFLHELKHQYFKINCLYVTMGGVFYIKKYFHKIKAIFREMALFESPVN